MDEKNKGYSTNFEVIGSEIKLTDKICFRLQSIKIAGSDSNERKKTMEGNLFK